MPDVVHLVIEEGAAKGRQFTVTTGGMRLGRSPKNDLVLDDPLLSRHHCRFFLKPGQGLWISDLGSVNQTLVNGAPVQELQLHPGDKVLIGGTVIRVVSDAVGPPSVAAPAGKAPVIDLGLSVTRAEPVRSRSNRGLLIAGLVAVTVAAVVIWAPKLLRGAVKPGRPSGAAPEAKPTLEVDYEKVQAGTNGIFRYRLVIAKDKTLAIRIDDTGKTHAGKEGKITGDQVQDLVGFIQEAGFFALDHEYAGLRQPGLFEQLDLEVTIGRKAHHCRVANRVEPPAFKTVREKLEHFGQVELGLYAMQFAPEQLTEMARTAYVLGRKLFDEREVAYPNLAASIKSFTEAQLDLETVEPKPDFYADVLTSLAEAQEELEKRLNNQSFLAERSIRLKAWSDAVRELRVLCDLLPPSDPRSQDAQKKLLEVENRLKKKR